MIYLTTTLSPDHFCSVGMVTSIYITILDIVSPKIQFGINKEELLLAIYYCACSIFVWMKSAMMEFGGREVHIWVNGLMMIHAPV